MTLVVRSFFLRSGGKSVERRQFRQIALRSRYRGTVMALTVLPESPKGGFGLALPHVLQNVPPLGHPGALMEHPRADRGNPASPAQPSVTISSKCSPHGPRRYRSPASSAPSSSASTWNGKIAPSSYLHKHLDVTRKLSTVFLQEPFHVQFCTYCGMIFDLC